MPKNKTPLECFQDLFEEAFKDSLEKPLTKQTINSLCLDLMTRAYLIGGEDYRVIHNLTNKEQKGEKCGNCHFVLPDHAVNCMNSESYDPNEERET